MYFHISASKYFLLFYSRMNTNLDNISTGPSNTAVISKQKLLSMRPLKNEIKSFHKQFLSA